MHYLVLSLVQGVLTLYLLRVLFAMLLAFALDCAGAVQILGYDVYLSVASRQGPLVTHPTWR